MNKELHGLIPIITVAFVVVFFAGFCIGNYISRLDWEYGAVKAGAGEWVAGKCGSPEFRWKTSAAQSAEGE